MSNQLYIWLNSCVDFARSIGSQPCLLCGARAHGKMLCAGCLNDLPRLPSAHCPCCALPTPLGETCGRCLHRPPAFDQSVAVYRYTHPMDALIQALKYKGELTVARFLAEALLCSVQTAARPDLIIPMPLHPNRLKSRGFNQATEIAKPLARHLTIPLDFRLCRRVRDAEPQTTLPLKERRKNIKGAFACAGDLTGKRVALVDDVMTSGASLNELAKCVKMAGAEHVQVWVVARTLSLRHNTMSQA